MLSRLSHIACYLSFLHLNLNFNACLSYRKYCSFETTPHPNHRCRKFHNYKRASMHWQQAWITLDQNPKQGIAHLIICWMSYVEKWMSKEWFIILSKQASWYPCKHKKVQAKDVKQAYGYGPEAWLVAEVRSQNEDIDSGFEMVEDTVDDLQEKIKVTNNNVALMIPWGDDVRVESHQD